MQDGGAKDLADTHLPRTLFGDKGRETQQPETGDKNGEHGKETRQLAGPFIIPKLAGIILVGEGVFEKIVRVIFFEYGLDAGKGPGQGSLRFQPDVDRVDP